jgi:hypothetical protein
MKSTVAPKTTYAELRSEDRTSVIGSFELPVFEDHPKFLVVGEDLFEVKSQYDRTPVYIRQDSIYVIEPSAVKFNQKPAEGGAK